MWMLLLCCFSLSIFLWRFCSIISAQCVRRLLQSTEEPSDSWETEWCETSCAEVHFLPTVTEAWGESWKMTDDWKLSDFSSRPSQKPWLPLRDEPGLPRLSFLWVGIAASRQEADNEITQDYVSQLTCMDPVSILESRIEWKWKRGGILSLAHFFFYISISAYSFCIVFSSFSYDSLPSCGKGLLMNVHAHGGNVWVSNTAFSLSDRSSTRV